MFASTNADTTAHESLQIPDETVFIAANLWSNEEWVGQPDTDGMYTTDPPGYVPVDVPTDVLDEVRDVVSGVEVPRRVALWDSATYEVDDSGYRLDGKYNDETGVMVVADPAVLDLIGLSAADRARLAETGVMNLQGVYAGYDVVIDSSFMIQPEGREPVTIEQVAPDDPIDSTAAIWPPLVTLERAEQLGLDVAVDGLYIVSDLPLDDDQLDALQQIQNDQWNGGSQIFDVSVPDCSSSPSGWRCLLRRAATNATSSSPWAPSHPPCGEDGLVTWFSSAIAQRVRPVRMSTLALD